MKINDHWMTNLAPVSHGASLSSLLSPHSALIDARLEARRDKQHQPLFFQHSKFYCEVLISNKNSRHCSLAILLCLQTLGTH